MTPEDLIRLCLLLACPVAIASVWIWRRLWFIWRADLLVAADFQRQFDRGLFFYGFGIGSFNVGFMRIEPKPRVYREDDPEAKESR